MPFAMFSVLLALISNFVEWDQTLMYFGSFNNGMMNTDRVADAFTAIILASALMVIPLSEQYVKRLHSQPAEYFSIMIFSLVGAIMMVTYENLLMLFLGIEILSISLYVLTGSNKRDLKGNEAALKYLLMGSFATGIMLFGVTLIYGASGSFSLPEIATYTELRANTTSLMLLMGLILVVIGILFKLSAAPFHFWTPDVYEGAPTVFTAFMSTVVKTAGFAALWKLLSTCFPDIYSQWWPTVAAIAIISLVVGNVIATQQDSFKRMLAYSGISHAGYMLLAVAAMGKVSTMSILFYSISYSAATIAAFGVLIAVSAKRGSDNYDSFNGLATTDRTSAAVLTIAMCSLAGIPLTAGFFGKFFVFAAALERGWVWLLVAAVLMSAVGIYYYFRVVIAMYMRPGSNEKIEMSGTFRLVLLVCTAVTLLLGVWPNVLGV